MCSLNYVYFAYGSCMDQNDFHRTCPTGEKLYEDAVLPRYRLRFNGYSGARMGGVANIHVDNRTETHGVLWVIKKGLEIKALDRREGAPWFYRRIPVTVRVGRHEVPAFTYEIVRPLKKEIAPSYQYAKLLYSSIYNTKYFKKVFKHISDLQQKEQAALEKMRWNDYGASWVGNSDFKYYEDFQRSGSYYYEDAWNNWGGKYDAV